MKGTFLLIQIAQILQWGVLDQTLVYLKLMDFLAECNLGKV